MINIKLKELLFQLIKQYLEQEKHQLMNYFSQTKDYLDKKDIKSKNFTKQIAFNIIPHIDAFVKDGYTKEEWKMENETKKILDEEIWFKCYLCKSSS